MARLNSKQVLDESLEENRALIEEVKQDFLGLSPEILNAKPDSNKWSILECFEHLNITATHYFPEMEKGIEQAKQKGWTAKETFKQGLVGGQASSGIRPKADGTIKTMKTFKTWDPVNVSGAKPTAVEDFLENLNRFAKIMESASEVDLQKVRVKSAIGNILRFRLGDAIPFISGHNVRHVLQAQKALEQARQQSAHLKAS